MKVNIYQKTAITTIVATIALIMVGGLVRAAGAGLGCPDWPQCFGMWIPPLSASELPPQYDVSLFNPFHTWLEYINRLIGVLIGLLITLTFVISFRYRKSDPVIIVASGAAFVMVLFQGWLGGQVVRSGLSAGMITLHMFVAMLILTTLLYGCFRAMNEKLTTVLPFRTRKTLLWISGTLFLLTMAQMILGTQVREAVDVAKNILELPRESWLDTTGWLYFIHRSFSWVIVLAGALLLAFHRKENIPKRLNRLGWFMAGLIILQIFVGVGMERLGMPGALQVIHLVGVAILICVEFLYIMIVKNSRA